MATSKKKVGNKKAVPKKNVVPKKSGQPSKYRPDFVKALVDHFNVPAGTWRNRRVKGSMTQVYEPIELPLLQTFAKTIGVAATTMFNWLKAVDEEGNLRYPAFVEAYEEAKRHQERILIHNGLNNTYRTAFAIFTMKNICGWRDAMSHELTGKDGKPIRAATITTDMTPQEAAEAYQATLVDS